MVISDDYTSTSVAFFSVEPGDRQEPVHHFLWFLARGRKFQRTPLLQQSQNTWRCSVRVLKHRFVGGIISCEPKVVDGHHDHSQLLLFQ